MGKKKESLFEKVEAEVLEGAKSYAKSYVKEKVTSKLVRVGEISVSFLLGFILLIIGIVQIVGHYFPVLDNGFNYLIFGVLFLLIGMMLKV
jgi:hypothetical protein